MKPKILPNGKFSLDKLLKAIEANSNDIAETLRDLQQQEDNFFLKLKEKKGSIQGVIIA